MDAPPREGGPRGPGRALLLGGVLLVISSYWGLHAFLVARAFVFSHVALQPGPVFVLFALVLANAALLRWGRRWALTRAELLLIYAMVVMSACANGLGMLAYLVPQVAALRYHAAAGRWGDIWERAPRALSLTDAEAAIEFYVGNSSIYQARLLRAWAGPVALWSAFLLALMAVLLAVAVIFRRRWVEEERLTFPLTYVPLGLTRGAGGSELWRNRALWAGFGAVAVVQSLNALRYYYPVAPGMDLKSQAILHLFQERPWNGMSRLSVSFYPFAIGIAFLLALDVSFSVWFFHLLARAQEIAACAFGLREPYAPATVFPYVDYQGIGGFIALGLFLVWSARRHLRGAVVDAWRNLAQPEEIMSYRWAFAVFGVGIAFVFVFMGAIGLSARMCALLVALYLLWCLVLARVLSEVGGGFVFSPDVHITTVMTEFLGTPHIGAKQLSALSQVHFLDLEFRDNPLPQDLQQLRIGQEAGVPPRQLLLALAVGSVLAIGAGWWASLAIYYKYGAAANVDPWYPELGRRAYAMLEVRLASQQGPDQSFIGAVGAGGLVTALLAVLRQRFQWWPFHPVGYVLAGTPTTWISWTPFLIGWLIKLAALKSGGLALYRRMVPFFVGMILGDFVTSGMWGVYGSLAGQATYRFF